MTCQGVSQFRGHGTMDKDSETKDFFFFLKFHLKKKFYLFIYGCVGSLFLCEGFL